MNDRLVLIEGEARGADSLSRGIAEELGIPFLPYPAYWRKDDGGRDYAAGKKRNQRMLDEHPDLDVVFAFKDKFDWSYKRGGTEDMCGRAKRAHVPSYVVAHA